MTCMKPASMSNYDMTITIYTIYNEQKGNKMRVQNLINVVASIL